MRIRKITFWSVFGLFALLALAIVWLWTADLGVFKPQLENWVSEKTGREFAIDGKFNVDLARLTVVIAEDIRLQNTAWADDPEMIEIGRAEIRVDLRSLFSGPIIVELIDINDVEIRLVKSEDGDANWDLPIVSAEKEIDESEPDSELGIFLELIDIDRVHLVYDMPERDKPLDLHVAHLDQRQRDDNFLELDLAAVLGGRDISLKGEIGTQQALLAGEDIFFDFVGQFDTFEFKANGWLDDVVNLRRPSIQLSATGPDIDDLTRMLGIGEEGEGDINLVATLTPQANGPLVLDVKGNIGLAEIEAAGAFSDLQDLEQVDIDLLAKGPDLGRLLRLVEIHQVREAPFMIDIDAQRQGSMLVVERARMVFADAEFNAAARIPSFPSLDDAKIDISINGPDMERFRYVLGLPGEADGAFKLDFSFGVSPSNVEILELLVQTSLGELRADGKLGDQPGYVGSTLDFQLNSESLGRFAGAYGIENLPDEAFSVRGGALLTKDGVRISEKTTGNISRVSVSLDGLVTLTSGIIGSDLEFGIAGPNLAALTGAFGVSEGVPDEPFDLNGQVQVREDGYRFRRVTGMLGSSELNIDGLLVPTKDLAGSRFDFSASGPAFEEIIDENVDLEVRPGHYKLSGGIRLQGEQIDFDDIDLVREAGNVLLNLELGMPVSRRWANFNLRAKGSDVRSILGAVDAFEADEAPFSIDVRGELRQSNLSFDRYNIRVGDATFQARGDLDFGDDGSSTQFSTTGDIPSLSKLGQINGRRFRDQGIKWNADVTGGDGEMTVENLELKLGESDVNGFIRYTLGDVPNLEVKIYSDSIVVKPLFEEEEKVYDPEPEFDDGKLIPDIVIPFEKLKQIDATLDIDIGEFIRDSLEMRNIDLRVDLQDGAVDIRNFDFGARYGWLKSRARIETGDGVGKASLELVARDFAFGLARHDAAHQMTGNFDVNLESTGNDLRTLVGNLDGVFFVETRSGRIANSRTLQAIYGDMLSEILSVINPFYKSNPYTDFNCILLPLEFVDGSATGKPNSFISTDKIRMTPKSVVDLKTEKIDMNIRSTPQRGLTISGGEILNPYIKIVGTLAAPRLAVDETGALVSGSAAVATAGLSILARAAWDRISRSKTPCVDTAKKGKDALGDRFPDFSGDKPD